MRSPVDVVVRVVQVFLFLTFFLAPLNLSFDVPPPPPPIHFHATPAELDAFFTNQFNESVMRRHSIASAAISVVHDSDVLFFKGFGFENFKKGRKTSSKTVYGLASVSKTFAAVLLIRILSDNGTKKPDLDMCVKDFMPEGVSVSETILGNYVSSNGFPRVMPTRCVTFRDLVTHTAGLDEPAFLGSAADIDADERTYFSTLISDIASDMPPRVRQPGVISSYNNRGVDLFGLAVANMNNLTYEEIVQEQIFDALKMSHSYLGLTNAEKDLNLCQMEIRHEDSFVPWTGPDWVRMGAGRPMGGVFSSSEDISRWLLALLHHGDALKLGKFGWDCLFETHYSATGNSKEKELSIGVNLYHAPTWSVDWIGHDGDLPPFSTEIMLQPDTNVAYSILMSCDDYQFGFRDHLRDEFTRTFLIPTNYCEEIGGVMSHENHCLKKFDLRGTWNESVMKEYEWGEFVGCFVETRRPHTSWVKLPRLRAQFVSSNRAGALCVSLSNEGATYLKIDDFSYLPNFANLRKPVLLLPKIAVFPSSTKREFLLAESFADPSQVSVDLTRGSTFAFLLDGPERKYWTTGKAFGSFEYLSDTSWTMFTFYATPALQGGAIVLIFAFCLCGVLWGGPRSSCQSCCRGSPYTGVLNERSAVNASFQIISSDEEEDELFASGVPKEMGQTCVLVFTHLFPSVSIGLMGLSILFSLLHYIIVFVVYWRLYLHNRTHSHGFCAVMISFPLTSLVLFCVSLLLVLMNVGSLIVTFCFTLLRSHRGSIVKWLLLSFVSLGVGVVAQVVSMLFDVEANVFLICRN